MPRRFDLIGCAPAMPDMAPIAKRLPVNCRRFMILSPLEAVPDAPAVHRLGLGDLPPGRLARRQDAADAADVDVERSQDGLVVRGAVAGQRQAEGRREYVVKSGDSLWQIAERELGKGARWPEIYELNKAVIGDNPDLIYPGQRYILPK